MYDECMVKVRHILIFYTFILMLQSILEYGVYSIQYLFFHVVQMLHDLNTYLHKAIPDTKLTIRKYLDVKFEYLVRPQHSH